MPSPGETRYVPNEVVLEIDSQLSPRAIEALARRHALTHLDSRRFQLANAVVYRWRVLNGRPVPEVIRALERDRQVRSAQPNYLFALSGEALASVDIIAPGVCIYSTSMNGGYATLSGTSMASPHVAGAAALIAANNPSFTPAQVKAQLINTGALDWNDSDDPDPVKERNLNAATY